MKYLLITIISFFYLSPSIAQKAKIKKHKFYVEYATLPEHYVEPDKRTYKLDVTGTYAIDKSAIENALNLRGWSLVQENPIVNAQLSVSGFHKGKPSQKKRVVETKDDDGKVKSKKTYYYYESTNTGSARLKVFGPDNKYVSLKKKKKEKKKEEANPFLDGSMSDSDISYTGEKVGDYDLSRSFKVTGKESTSVKTALSNYRSAASSAYANHKSAFAEYVTSATNGTLNKIYGYNKKRDYAKFKKLKSKKHPEYEMYTNATEAMKSIFSKKHFNNSNEELLAALAPIEKYMQECADKYTKKDKHSKRLRSASLYNLAQIYYYTDRPVKMIETGQIFIDMKHDEKFGENFIEKGEELKNLLDFHHMDGRYFVTNEDASQIDSEEEETDGDIDTEKQKK